MSAAYGLRFGPVALALEGPPPHPLLRPWLCDPPVDARRVTVSLAPTLPTDAEVGFALTAHPDHDQLTIIDDPARHAPWLAAVCELVARDAPLHGCFLLHAGAVRVEGGVALLIAAPGVGKTTAVRAAGERAFASNSVLVEGGDGPSSMRVRAMPFNREAAPELEAPDRSPLVALAFVHRHSLATVEWMPGSTATMRLMSHVTRPRGEDPHARVRAGVALSLGGRVRALTLGLPWGPGYLAALDTALHPTTSPP